MNGTQTLRTNLGGLIAGVLLVFFVTYAAMVAIPLMTSALWEETTATPPAREGPARAGKAIYDDEGCWYCHTQAVRTVVTDLGLGKVTLADRMVRDRPPAIGMVRLGPDLSCVGSRYESPDALAAFVANPREQRATASMPPFEFLGTNELSALGAYLHSLTC